MELEEARDILANCIADYVISSYCNNTCDEEVGCKNEDCIFQQAIDVVLNHITKQEKMIELMTNFIYHIGYYEDSYGNSCAIIQDSCFKNKTKESCEECIKQYFEKKAEENE